MINYTGLKWLPKCGTITADCDKLHRTHCWLINYTGLKLLPALLLLTVINYTGLKWLRRMWHNYCWLINYTGLKWFFRMWHNYCWLLWITQVSKCGTITAASGELHRTQTASLNVAQLLLTVMNHTGLKWLLKMWHNYCWQWWITQDKWLLKCGIIITGSCEFYRSEMASKNVTWLLPTVLNSTKCSGVSMCGTITADSGELHRTNGF